MRAIKTILVAAALALVAAPASVSAQPAAAIGHPLPDKGLPAGTVMVRVIAGDPSKPVTDTEVHVSVAGVDHPARTNAEGRATLPGVAANALVKISVKGASGDVSSDEFPMPSDGGVRVMLTTQPMQEAPGGMGGPMAGGPMAGGGRPEPRMMSGRGRPDQSVTPGQIIATVTYDDLADKQPPADEPIVLVGYSDAGITSKIVRTDASGHAVFDGLDRTGATGYFLLARMSRPDAIDRVMTVPPLQLGATAGWRVMMSAEKRDSRKPPVDDLGKIEPPADVPAGKIMASLAGVPTAEGKAELYDVIAGKVIATAPIGAEKPKGVTLETSPVTADDSVPVGALGIQLARRTPQDTIPLDGVSVQVRAVPTAAPAPAKPDKPATDPKPATDTGSGISPTSDVRRPTSDVREPPPPTPPPTGAGQAVDAPVLQRGVSAKDGWLQLTGLPTGVPLQIELRIGDELVYSSQITLPAAPASGKATGSRVMMIAQWNQRAMMQAMFDAPADAATRPGATYLVQATQFGKQYRSEPFQVLPDRGTAASIVVYPRVFLQFALDATAEDEFLAVRGEIAVRNFSWAPYRASDDGLIVPAPAGFKGAVVAETQEVATDPEGFRVLRPLPPFGFTFRAGFSLPIHGESATFDMPLPSGLLQGDFAVRMIPGMEVQAPTAEQLPTIKTETVKDNGNTFFVMHQLTIMPRPGEPAPHLTFSISGLPAPPAWKQLAPKLAGLLVIVLVLLGAAVAIGAAMRAGRVIASDDATRKRRVDDLYQELLDLEAQGDDADQERITAVRLELEQLIAAERDRARAKA